MRKTSGRIKLQVHLVQKLILARPNKPKDTIVQCQKKKFGLHTLSSASDRLVWNIVKFLLLPCGAASLFPFLADRLSLPLCVHAVSDKSLSVLSGIKCQETNNTKPQQVHTHWYSGTCSSVLCFGWLCLLYRCTTTFVTGGKKERQGNRKSLDQTTFKILNNEEINRKSTSNTQERLISISKSWILKVIFKICRLC